MSAAPQVNAPNMEEQKSTPQDIPQPDRTQDTMPASTPVEMTTLDSKANTSDLSAERQTSTSSHPPGPQRTDTVTAFKQAAHPPSPPSDPLPETSAVSRTVSTAIGPSSDLPVLPIKDAEETGPALTVTLLLTSGARHPFRLDSNYLRKRNVEVSNNDPYELSVYKLKELILREWRDEWEQQPASPSSIRLISFGKLLEDKAILRDLKLSAESPNVIHMTIKPQDFVEEEDAKGGKTSMSAAREEQGRSPGCRCIVM